MVQETCVLPSPEKRYIYMYIFQLNYPCIKRILLVWHLAYLCKIRLSKKHFNSSQAPGLIVDLWGFMNIHNGTLLFVLQWQCIGSKVSIKHYRKSNDLKLGDNICDLMICSNKLNHFTVAN